MEDLNIQSVGRAGEVVPAGKLALESRAPDSGVNKIRKLPSISTRDSKLRRSPDSFSQTTTTLSVLERTLH